VERDISDLRDRLQQTLGSTYDLERELAGAGMSRVFVAVDRRFGRRVVIKVLAPELAAGVSAERFAREVALAARLQQANIVPMFDAGEIDGLPYYTMPWIEGQSLRTRLDTLGQASVPETVAIVGDVAKALSYAHAQGVVHRDIKPENILLSGHTAVVTDFGIAKALSASRTLAPFETITQVGTSLGTPAYMAPEQALGDPATDHRADLYALGVVAYELLAGERPFRATTLHELIRAHVTATPPPLLARRRDIPVSLAALVMRCLEKDPGRRPASADELLAALSRPQPKQWSEPSFPGTTPKRRVARRTTVAAAAALVVVAAVAAALWRRASRPAPDTDPLRVFVAAPVAPDVSIGSFADLSRGAVTRALGQVQNLRVAEQSTGSSGDGRGDLDAEAIHQARAAQASLVVASSVYPHGQDSARIEFRVLDVRTGDLLRGIRPISVARGSSDGDWSSALDPLLSTVAIATFPWLGPRTLPLGEPPRYVATRELLTALSLGTRVDSAARGAMVSRAQRATELDTSFLQGKLWSAALRALVVPPAFSPQSRAHMDSTLQYIEPLRERLTPFEVALLDYVAADRRSDQGGMLTSLRRLKEIAPEVILARNLPQLLLDLNRPREALRVLETAGPVRDLQGRLEQPADIPFYWMTLADLHHYLGDYAAARDAAARLRQLRPDALNSVRYQLHAAAALGDSAAVEALLNAARTIPAQPSSYNFFGDIALQTGQELEAHGRPAFGREVARRALQWFESRRSDEVDWRVRFRHALALHELGDQRRSLEILRPLLSLDSSSTLFIGLHGRLAAALGDTARAGRIDAALAAMGNQIGGANTLERAFIAANLGQRDRAVALLEEALAQGVGFRIRWRLHWFTDLRPVRDYPPFRNLLEPQG
jgi:tetratricopeptide (TPR) repeat protein